MNAKMKQQIFVKIFNPKIKYANFQMDHAFYLTLIIIFLENMEATIFALRI